MLTIVIWFFLFGKQRLFYHVSSITILIIIYNDNNLDMLLDFNMVKQVYTGLSNACTSKELHIKYGFIAR